MNVTLGAVGSCEDIVTFAEGTSGTEVWPSLGPALPWDDHTWNPITDPSCLQAKQGRDILACSLLPALLSLERSSSADSNQSCLFRAQA